MNKISQADINSMVKLSNCLQKSESKSLKHYMKVKLDKLMYNKEPDNIDELMLKLAVLLNY